MGKIRRDRAVLDRPTTQGRGRRNSEDYEKWTQSFLAEGKDSALCGEKRVFLCDHAGTNTARERYGPGIFVALLEVKWGLKDMKARTAGERAPDDAALDTKALDAIGQALKAHYDELVYAPLPDKFVDLLARLELEEQRAATKGRRNAPK